MAVDQLEGADKVVLQIPVLLRSKMHSDAYPTRRKHAETTKISELHQEFISQEVYSLEKECSNGADFGGDMQLWLISLSIIRSTTP